MLIRKMKKVQRKRNRHRHLFTLRKIKNSRKRKLKNKMQGRILEHNRNFNLLLKDLLLKPVALIKVLINPWIKVILENKTVPLKNRLRWTNPYLIRKDPTSKSFIKIQYMMKAKRVFRANQIRTQRNKPKEEINEFLFY